MAPFVILLLLLLPLAELQILWRVGAKIGAMPVLGLLLLGFFAGIAILRGGGLRLMREVRGELAAGRMPGEALLDGALVMACGLLLMVPGFLTDAVALVLLLTPPLRRLVGARVLRSFSGGVKVFRAGEEERSSGWGRMDEMSGQKPGLPGVGDPDDGLKEAQARVIESDDEQKHL